VSCRVAVMEIGLYQVQLAQVCLSHQRYTL